VSRLFKSTLPIFIFFASLIVLTTAGTAEAWQTIIPGFDHLSPYGGEAEWGKKTGGVEYVGRERYVRAGADEVFYTNAQVAWNKAQSSVPALVFHVAEKNKPGNKCTNLRIPGVANWNWSNLPGVRISTTGCGLDPDNEVRFHAEKTKLVGGVKYFIQSLYRDTGYNAGAGPKEVGQIGLDSYATNWLGGHDFSDFHGKVCIDPDWTYAPARGVC
jgi:hypothetical protein